MQVNVGDTFQVNVGYTFQVNVGDTFRVGIVCNILLLRKSFNLLMSLADGRTAFLFRFPSC